MFKRIDHAEIVTDQIDRTVQFYTEVLGFGVQARDRIEESGLGVPIDLGAGDEEVATSSLHLTDGAPRYVPLRPGCACAPRFSTGP